MGVGDLGMIDGGIGWMVGMKIRLNVRVVDGMIVSSVIGNPFEIGFS